MIRWERKEKKKTFRARIREFAQLGAGSDTHLPSMYIITVHYYIV